MQVEVRPYDRERDLAHVARMWRETRWIQDDEAHRAALATFLAEGVADVGLVDGEAECLVHRTPGRIVYDDVPLPLSAITAVTTSPVGRRRGLASALTARAVRAGAAEGAAVSALGTFDLGFYDRMGFGTGAAETLVTFDPASLRVGHVPYATPSRLSVADAEDIAAAMSARLSHHGLVTLDARHVVAAEWAWLEQPFALGYRSGGRLTHFVAGSLKEGRGPFEIALMSYETGGQLMELLRLLRELSDQLHSVRMIEPPQLQLYALIEQPNRQRSRSLATPHETIAREVTWWQLRVLDVPIVVAARRWEGAPFDFTLDLIDPVVDIHDVDDKDGVAGVADGTTDAWRGVAGRYRVRVGETSSADPFTGAMTSRHGPTLRCSVNTFSRLWFGVRPATSLVLSDGLDAPAELLGRLDRALRLPAPQPARQF